MEWGLAKRLGFLVDIHPPLAITSIHTGINRTAQLRRVWMFVYIHPAASRPWMSGPYPHDLHREISWIWSWILDLWIRDASVSTWRECVSVLHAWDARPRYSVSCICVLRRAGLSAFVSRRDLRTDIRVPCARSYTWTILSHSIFISHSKMVARS